MRPTESSAWRRPLGLMLTHVVGKGVIDLPTLVERMSCRPAQAFGLLGGTLAEGSVADVTVFDPKARVDGGPEGVPLQEPEHPVRGVGARRAGALHDRGREGGLRGLSGPGRGGLPCNKGGVTRSVRGHAKGPGRRE